MFVSVGFEGFVGSHFYLCVWLRNNLLARRWHTHVVKIDLRSIIISQKRILNLSLACVQNNKLNSFQLLLRALHLTKNEKKKTFLNIS